MTKKIDNMGDLLRWRCSFLHLSYHISTTCNKKEVFAGDISTVVGVQIPTDPFNIVFNSINLQILHWINQICRRHPILLSHKIIT